MNQHNDEVAILVLTHNNYVETRYFINNLMLNTKAKYRLHIFDYQSDDENLISYLKQICEENKWYLKSVSNETPISDVYNQMLETIYQKYVTFMPINAIVNDNWLNNLMYYYKSIKNSGCISIKSKERNLKLSSLLFENAEESEDEMRVVWVNSTSILNDFIFFEKSRLDKVGKFDKRIKCRGLELAEFSFRFLGQGLLNYYVTKSSCIRIDIKDDVLFPKITKQAKEELKTQIDIMIKQKQYKKQ